jgi:ankyrin repeat protein
VDVAQMLLGQGAELETRDSGGATPLENAARSRHGQVVALLLAKGAAARSDILAEAVLKGQPDVVSALLDGGCSPNARGKSDATPLDTAALKGNLEIVRALIEHGADVGARNSYGATPLHDAAVAGHRDVVALLLDNKANLEAREEESGATALYDAASMGRVDVVELLLARGANAKTPNKAGVTPLRAAVVNGFDQVAAVLRAHGAR